MRFLPKFFAAFLAAAFLFVTPCDAAKMTLSDTLTAEDFVKAYNDIAEYPITDHSAHRRQGNFESYLAAVGENDMLIINALDDGKLDNIVVLHRGGVTDEVKKQLFGEIFAAVFALGFENDDLNKAIIDRAVQRLGLETDELQVSVIKREDIGRIYVLTKSYNEGHDAHMISVTAQTPDVEE